MPVPPLPDPPVGRFPPEHPVWPPKNQGLNMPYNNQKRIGPELLIPQASQLMSSVASSLSNNNRYYPYPNDNHRSDKNPGHVSQVHPKMPTQNQINETSYNNYISKLTSSLDLNNNNIFKQGHNLEQLKHVYGSSSELSNKVIDYNNKRMTVESLKYNNFNGNQTAS